MILNNMIPISPLSLAIAMCVAGATLGGFPTVEILRQKQLKTQTLINTTSVWWGDIYTVTLPLAMILVTYTESSEVPELYRKMVWAVVFVPVMMLELIFRGGLEHSFWARLWSSPAAFGIRGCTVGLLAVVANWLTSQIPEKHYQVISLICFSLAAFMTCGLGSIAGWAAYPEYGAFKEAKRQMMATIQVYFVMGFGFQVADAIQHQSLTATSS